MQEKLLHYIWQYQLINLPIFDTEKQSIHVIHPGYYNRDAGPDFFKAQIKIGNTLWIGNVEIHVNSSDWNKHGHQHDEKYANTILHVVYHHDSASIFPNTPTLELKNYIKDEILIQYKNKFIQDHQIPCQNHIHLISDILLNSWLERLFVDRIERKNMQWNEECNNLQYDWQHLILIRLMQSMGFKINDVAMTQLARSIPIKVIQHTKHDLILLEALLFGQAGFLEQLENEDNFGRTLEKHYHFIRRKFQLTPIPKHLWNFLRLRPSNFPTIRIAQLAYLLHHNDTILNEMLYGSIEKVKTMLNQIKTSSYWEDHYLFGKNSSKQTKTLGEQSINNIIVNTVIPTQMLYAKYHQSNIDISEYLHQFSLIKAEKNSITDKWCSIGIQPLNSMMSQGLIELYNNYCKPKRCLDCNIGHKILKNI